MAVLSVDLALRCWSDLGIVVLDRVRRPLSGRSSEVISGLPRKPSLTQPDESGHYGREPAEPAVRCEIIPPLAFKPDADSGPVDANILAGLLNHLCSVRDIRVILLDGPQAWKSDTNGLEHARVSERLLNTAAKTGLPGMVKPIPYRPYAEFCLDVYDGLCRRGWRRLETCGQPGSPPDRVLVESYPYAAWKSLGIKPLPAKRRARVSDLAEAYGALRALLPILTDRPPNHDQLQAIVGGLAGLALEESDAAGTRIVGKPPRREEGHWREGFIVLPIAPQRPMGLRWLKP